MVKMKSLSHSENKTKGMLAELAFQLEAYKRGFKVARTYGDNDPFDFILYKDGKFSRIQVKSTSFKRANRHGDFNYYSVEVCSGHKHVSSEVDFLVLYLRNEDIWYIAPAQSINSKRFSVNCDNPNSNRHTEVFKEA
jgi:hypothetical protein